MPYAHAHMQSSKRMNETPFLTEFAEVQGQGREKSNL